MRTAVIGWDIGGSNTKVARVDAGAIVAVCQRAFEVHHALGALVPLLRDLADAVGADASAVHAVTMTAELSRAFRTKREGVSFVLDAIETAFPGARVHVFTVEGRFLDVAEARRQPRSVAAANWMATATLAARQHPDALLIDVGSTTSDIVPIAGGRASATGRTDPERLASGELVYTGALRSPAESIASHVPLGDARAGVAAEGFALAGDVHLWRGDLAEADYTTATPDGRPATREHAGERLARLVCGDRETVDEAAIDAIADALAEAQVARIAAAAAQVLARHATIRSAVVTGLGAFLGEAAARVAGLPVVALSSDLGCEAAVCAPAASVALLLDADPSRPGVAPSGVRTRVTSDRVGPPLRQEPAVAIVVKLGGGVLAHADHFTAVLAALGVHADGRLLIVPGGGPFADAVRDVDARLPLSDEAAHWMAILGMDQYAHLIASRLSAGVLVHDRAAITVALRRGQVPVLAPYRWLREADPLPHTWDVTSDSLAAWIAGEVGARRLVLVKPPGASGDSLMDASFARVLPAGVAAVPVAADRGELLLAALGVGARIGASQAAARG